MGTVLYIRLLIYAGLSLFIKSGPYVYMVVCVVYAYNLTIQCSMRKRVRLKNMAHKHVGEGVLQHPAGRALSSDWSVNSCIVVGCEFVVMLWMEKSD